MARRVVVPVDVSRLDRLNRAIVEVVNAENLNIAERLAAAVMFLQECVVDSQKLGSRDERRSLGNNLADLGDLFCRLSVAPWYEWDRIISAHNLETQELYHQARRAGR